MGGALTTIDIIIFFGSLMLIMGLGLWYGGKDKTTDDYFLAGNSTRWWGVAGSIFGSNVSANHIVGMLGVGYSIGFAQSHFEIGAVVGLLLLCYGFLPIYKKLGVTTLGEYLARRYDERSRLTYVLILLFIIVFVMMVPGFYIGSRSLNILISGNYQHVDYGYYCLGIVAMAIITGSYTIFGGLRAVIYTDVFQSVLLLSGTLIVAWITFSQPEIDGWSNMMEIDQKEKELMHLYLPSDHPELPWTGVLSGLFILHFYYWGANQFIVQRALSAKSMTEARFGIIFAGFLKLVIPFFSIGTGVAAYYLFQRKGLVVDQDAAFTTLITEFVQPLGYGILGLVAAGLIGAILSSLDSMMNSAATLITFDVYKRYFNKQADDAKLIKMGKIWIFILIVGAACLAAIAMDPNSDASFFLLIARHQANLISGLVVAFVFGIFWKRANASGAFYAILTGVVSSYLLPIFYTSTLRDFFQLETILGVDLNFLHTVFFSCILAALVHIFVSLKTKTGSSEDVYELTWYSIDGHNGIVLKKVIYKVIFSFLVFLILATLMVQSMIPQVLAGAIAGFWTWGVFAKYAFNELNANGYGIAEIVKDDRFYSGLLAACVILIMFLYY